MGQPGDQALLATKRSAEDGVLHCYLGTDQTQPPRPGDRALCGHVRTKAWDGGEAGSRCVVCVDLLNAHQEGAESMSAGEQR